MRRFLARLSLVLGLAFGATGLVVGQAGAAPPTVVTDDVRSVQCSATTQDGDRLNFTAAISDAQGRTSANGSLQTATHAVNGDATSTWSDTTFTAVVPMYSRPLDPDGGGHFDGEEPEGEYIGDLEFAGTYAVGGQPETYVEKGKDGNIRYSSSNTVTPLAVSVTLLDLPGFELVDVSCEGESLVGKLSITNPNLVVQRGNDLTYACTAVNASPYPYIEKVEEGWYVDVASDEDSTVEASGVIAFGKDGAWQGLFRVADNEGSEQTVPASARLEQIGQPQHRTNGDRGIRDHARVITYRLQVSVDLPGQDAASVDCTLWDAALTTRWKNGA